MVWRRKQTVGYRILFVITIPAMYFFYINIMELLSDSTTNVGYATDWRGRRLLQASEFEQPGNDSFNCTPPAIKEFPPDGFTRQQRQAGFIIIHFAIAIYLFLLLAIVCDDFFVPSIKKICEKLDVTEDVAGATVMAAASSSPELFINVIGTFVTEGDLGVGTIVGSAVFNILAVPACCAIFANEILHLEWWPISRDTLAYAFTVLLLILTLWDGRIEWYEALILVVCYVLYILAYIAICVLHIMLVELQQQPSTVCCFSNIGKNVSENKQALHYDIMMARTHPCENKNRNVKSNVGEERDRSVNGFSVRRTLRPTKRKRNLNISFIFRCLNFRLIEAFKFDVQIFIFAKSVDIVIYSKIMIEFAGNCCILLAFGYLDIVIKYLYCLFSDDIVDITTWPSSTCQKIWWVITWPINVALLLTIPDCRRRKLKSWYTFTFIMCVIWIGISSYIIGWVITIIGDTFRIPDSIMGLTFLAAGMSVPEAVSSVIVANQGYGAMGISNSIGSNVFDVLLCLGLPWFVKATLLPKVPGQYYIQINSQGLIYSSVSLFSTLIMLYGALFINKFTLSRTVGIACLVMYVIFLIFASVVELNTFFVVNLPVCID
ncbi:Sodium/potassium/calcium exchanger 5 [Trachymyrmex cornetzi]|uniref:Sodium/potassium/calcium exchanger 5 n=1 Tax=Trachymyrmex cornetzi TaxID=471704 RepID=A0A195EFY9_9HYME|nr:Sodium/potassium/calcium exchanger 5 [Trachymyrmex cornetzi]